MSMLKKRNIISAGVIENDNEIISVTDISSRPADDIYLLYQADHAIYSIPADLNKTSPGNPEADSQAPSSVWQFRKNSTHKTAPLQIQEEVLSVSNTTVSAAANTYKSTTAAVYAVAGNTGSSDEVSFALRSGFSGMDFNQNNGKPYSFSSNLSYSDVPSMVYGTNPSTNQLIKNATWDQGSPYNDFCPLDPVTKERSVVGCVATAASQILYYWKYPKSITFSATDSYISEGTNGNISIPNDAAKLDFPTFAELNSYLFNIKYDFSDKEVAALSFAVGIKFEMGYSSYESGAYVIPDPFKDDFGFISAGALHNKYVDSDGTIKNMDLTSADVISVLADNLNSGHPIFTSIRDSATNSGHAVVIDGFRSSDNYFHFNMGWAGADDGWYSLKNVDGFDIIQTLVIDLFPTGILNQTYTVTNTNDYGAGSLRRAIEMANNKNGADTIVFDPSLAGLTIKLTSGAISITDDLNITGFAKNTVTVSGGWTGAAGTGSRIFYVSDNNDTSKLNVSISGLKLTAGYSGENGGAIYNEENLALERLSVSNSKGANGGAISSNSTLEISNSLISGNVATGDGGGIYISSTGSLTSLNNTIAGNTAADNAGGVLSLSSSLKLDNTIIAANNAKTDSDIHGNANSSSSNNIIGNGGGANLTNGVNGNQTGTAEKPLAPGFVTPPQAGTDKVWGTADDIKGDYYLNPDSIAVDKGNNSAISADYESDVNGISRVVGSTVDVGAYEYHPPDTVKPSIPDGLTDDNSAGNVVLLDWNDAKDDDSGVGKYQVQVDTYDNFSSPDKSLFVTKSEAVVSGLNDGTYFWRVRTQDNAGNWSDWSVQDTFSVKTPDTAPPTIPSVLKQTISGGSAALSWNQSFDTKSGLKGYEVQIDDSYYFNSPEQTLNSVTNNLNVDFVSDGTRYWRVRAQDNDGNWSSWSVLSSFSIVIPDILPPTVPVGLKETITGGAASLDWNDSADNKSGVRRYEVQIDNNDDFSSPEYNATPVVSSAYFSGLSDGTYHWRTRAQDNAGNWSNWSNPDDFIISLPDIIAPSVPAGLTQATIQGTAMLDWSDSTDDKSGVKRYEVQVDKHNNFLSPEQATSVTASTVTVSGLTDGSYFWRVRALDNAGNYSTWSTPSNFTILLDFVAPSIPTALKPTAGAAGLGTVFLDWKDATDDKSGVKLYSIQIDKNNVFSSPVKTLSSDGNVSAATVTGLSAGKYYSRVRTQDKAGNFSGWSNSASFLITPQDKAANEYKTAKDISTIDNCVGFGDAADFYKLTMTNAGLLTLNLTGLSGDANLSLLDSAGKVLKSSKNKGLANESIANLALLGGIYYVKVDAADNGRLADNTSYSLTHTEKYYPTDNASNTWQTAKDISTLDNWVGFGDTADFYKLTMTNAGTLTLNLSGLTGDANLSLLDASGKVLKTSSNRGLANESVANLALLGGVYYVKVVNADSKSSASTSYTLTHTEKYYPTDNASNTWQAAKDISTLDNWVGFGDAADFYKLTMTGAGTLTLGLTGLSGDANLSLLDASGRVLKTSANRGIAGEAITANLLSGTYYVNVAAASGVNNADYTLTHAEKYCPADTVGNSFDAARKITSNGTVPEWLGFGDKEDYYKFTTTADTAVELKLTGLSSDVNLYLYDASKKQIAASAKIGKADETIARTLKTGTYYVKALLTGKDDTAYSLAFNIDPAAIKSGSLQLFSSSRVPGSSSSLLDSNANEPRKNHGMLAC